MEGGVEDRHMRCLWEASTRLLDPQQIGRVCSGASGINSRMASITALSINVGAALVDVSPLSTVGALCVATVSETDVARTLFTKMLLWGFAMTVVGAILCQFLAGPFARL